MAGISHLILIDESEEKDFNQGSRISKAPTRFWFTAAVSYEIPKGLILHEGIKRIISERFKRPLEELKGAEIIQNLKERSTVSDVAADLGQLVTQTGAAVWVMFSKREAEGHPRDAARALLPERITRWPNLKRMESGSCLVLLDLSDAHTLAELSRSVREFHNFFTKQGLPPAIIPTVVGVDSRDWAGIQIADVYAHLGAHYRARKWNLKGANESKAEAFEHHLYPTLMKRADGRIEGIGYKAW